MSNRAPFVAMAVAESCSMSGTRLSMIAVPWLVLTLTGSATWTGVAGFVEMLPYVVGKALGGPIIDRLGAKRVAVWCDSASVPLIGAIPLLHAVGHLGIAAILVIAALVGTVRGPGGAIVGRFMLAVQDDTGLIKLVHRFTGADVVLHTGSVTVPGSDLQPGPAFSPGLSTVRYGGRSYRADELAAVAPPPWRVVRRRPARLLLVLDRTTGRETVER